MIKIISAIVKFFPFIMAAIRLVEELSKEAAMDSGSKKQAAMTLVIEFAAAIGFRLSAEVEEVIGKVIDILVGVLNATIWRDA